MQCKCTSIKGFCVEERDRAFLELCLDLRPYVRQPPPVPGIRSAGPVDAVYLELLCIVLVVHDARTLTNKTIQQTFTKAMQNDADRTIDLMSRTRKLLKQYTAPKEDSTQTENTIRFLLSQEAMLVDTSHTGHGLRFVPMTKEELDFFETLFDPALRDPKRALDAWKAPKAWRFQLNGTRVLQWSDLQEGILKVSREARQAAVEYVNSLNYTLLYDAWDDAGPIAFESSSGNPIFHSLEA